MLYIQLQRKLQEGVENQTTPSLEQVQQFVYQQLMPRLLFLPLEGIVSLLDSLGFYRLVTFQRRTSTPNASKFLCPPSVCSF